MSFLSKLGKKLSKVGQTVLPTLGKAIPLVASFVGGPVAALVTTPVGAAISAAGTTGSRKNKLAAALGTLKIGAGAALATGVISQVITGNAGSSVLGSIGKLLGVGQPNNATGTAGAAKSEQSGSVLGEERPQEMAAGGGVAPGAPQSSLIPVLVIGGVVVAAWALMRKKAA